MKKAPKHKTLNCESNKFLVSQLKRIRMENGFTMRSLVAPLGKPHSYVGKIENNERRIDVIEFIDYCNAINADPLEIFKDLLKEKQQK